MLYLEQFVYNNKLRSLHPLEKMLFCLVTLGIVLISGRFLVSLAVLLIMLFLLKWRALIPGRVLIKLFSIPLGFLLVGLLTIAAVVSSQPETMLISLRVGTNYLGITSGSLEMAWHTGFTSLSAISCLYFLALTTPMTEVVYALQLLRLPSLLVELMTLIYRFIFVFLETALQIYTAQSSRWGYSTFARSLRSLALLVGNVWARAFFKTQHLYAGLLARGYDQELRFLSPQQQYSRRTIGLFALTDVVLIVLAIV